MDDYEFLHFLSQYNYWSTRIYAWKSLRDRFAPDYKEWLQKRNQQLSSENNNNDMPDVKYNETKVQTPEATTSDEKLNDLIENIRKAKVCMIAGRPSLGKTDMVLSIAKNTAIEQGIPTLFFSSELNTEHLTNRMVSNLCELEIEGIGTNTYNENRHEIYVKGMKRVKNSPLFIDDTHSLSVLELAPKVRQLVGKQWIRLVIVDYLQLMKRGGSSCFDEEPTKIVHSMRELAMELNITFIVCAQLPPRARGERKRPGLSTIKRFLGNIEKETDMIVCLHRPEYYRIMRKDDEEVHGIAEIIVIKNAFSEKHNFHLIYRPRFCRFYD